MPCFSTFLISWVIIRSNFFHRVKSLEFSLSQNDYCLFCPCQNLRNYIHSASPTICCEE
uniref:Uncharacterized protein n=1 Tax=Arundo donax TaxID=35708 RepID=A0A0A9FPC0_ARUDO